jgi:Fic family protein
MTDGEVASYQPFPPFADWADLPVDEDTFARFENVLRELKEGTEPERLDRAVRTATRLAAIDTGAIEGLYEVDRGFTMTVAVEAAAWERAIDAREPVVRRSFEDALRAYDFVLDLATSRTDVSEKAVKEIHDLICASQETYRVHTSVGVQEQPLPGGEYKQMPNNPTNLSTGRIHHFAPPSDVPAEMDRLVRELRSDAFSAAHPVLQAAYAHYAFVAIHPFVDGNGRVARALASVYVYRRPGVPLVVFADQKDDYIGALEHADAGDPRPWARFIGERAADIVGLVQVATALPDEPLLEASLSALRDRYVDVEGVSIDELTAIARRIKDAAAAEILGLLQSLELPPGLTWGHAVVGGALGSDDRYRDATETKIPSFDMGTADLDIWPVQDRLGVAVRRGDQKELPLFSLRTDSGMTLGADLREVYPVLSQVFKIKLKTWADAFVRQLVARLERETR